ncbi:MAG: RHS repeat-associated core domain-containing protein, partial [Pyrinomonadaceae bacterium]
SPRIITDATGQTISRRDFKPYGEEIGRSNQGTDAVRKKFTGYQKDKETSLDFAEARMYENRFGRFTAIDPLLASGIAGNPQSWNRYVYCHNSPYRFTDPSGLVTGDYYDQDGDWIGTDGRLDNKNYLIANRDEARQIQRDTNNGMGVSTPDDFTSLLELPEQAVRQEIGVDAVARSNAATSTERGARGGFAETGGVVIQTENGQLAVPAVQGAMGDPRRQGAAAEINVENPANPSLISQTTDPSSWVTTYHIHPSAEITNRDNSVSTFNQPPSNYTETVNGQQVARGDIPNAANPSSAPVTLGYRIVVAAGRANVNGQNTGGQRVYFYNGTGVLGSMPTNRFVNLPARRRF